MKLARLACEVACTLLVGAVICILAKQLSSYGFALLQIHQPVSVIAALIIIDRISVDISPDSEIEFFDRQGFFCLCPFFYSPLPGFEYTNYTPLKADWIVKDMAAKSAPVSREAFPSLSLPSRELTPEVLRFTPPATATPIENDFPLPALHAYPLPLEIREVCLSRSTPPLPKFTTKTFKELTSTERILLPKLNKYKMREIEVKSDGNCFFYAISFLLHNGDISRHGEIRSAVHGWLGKEDAKTYKIDVMDGCELQFVEDDFETFVTSISKEKTFATLCCCYAVAELFNVVVNVISSISDDLIIHPKRGTVNKEIYLSYTGIHYNPLIHDPKIKDKPLMSVELLKSMWECSTCTRMNGTKDFKCHSCDTLKPTRKLTPSRVK